MQQKITPFRIKQPKKKKAIAHEIETSKNAQALNQNSANDHNLIGKIVRNILAVMPEWFLRLGRRALSKRSYGDTSLNVPRLKQ
ncbi:hypothetical protein [Picosynechococcus sp. PCC 73109]|uniref:hypothetical protein n=1 Tax=Picosynechococcus sp. PCC 73109 TaxID=374982 RepID=UPI0007458CB8|nr:hypothetical protein [Picosynechococcus sp. PCC 73109]AMA10841.1 hypothetical protein AWQ23_15530 [Picosynechococcus sp. PCC 73109]